MIRRRDVVPLVAAGALNVLLDRQARAAAEAADVYSILQQQDGFSVWRDLVDRVGLAALLKGPRPVTVFAPTDYALSVGPDLSIPHHGTQATPEWSRTIRLLVEAHIVEGLHDLPEISSSSRTYDNLAGGLVSISRNKYNITASWESSVSSSEGTISASPAKARNGLVYPIGPLVAQPLRQR